MRRALQNRGGHKHDRKSGEIKWGEELKKKMDGRKIKKLRINDSKNRRIKKNEETKNRIIPRIEEPKNRRKRERTKGSPYKK
jgi:hypothetical protein